MRYFLSTLALTALASSCVTALGINCRGSFDCGQFHNRINPGQTVADSLRQEIAAHVSDSRWYQNGQHIVCVDGARMATFAGSVCAVLRGTGGMPGNEIKTLAKRIVEHGCKTCGSVPVFYDKGDNNVDSHGELTFKFVNRVTTGDGWCSSIKGRCQYD